MIRTRSKTKHEALRALRRSSASPNRPASTFGISARPSNIFGLTGTNASISTRHAHIEEVPEETAETRPNPPTRRSSLEYEDNIRNLPPLPPSPSASHRHPPPSDHPPSDHPSNDNHNPPNPGPPPPPSDPGSDDNPDDNPDYNPDDNSSEDSDDSDDRDGRLANALSQLSRSLRKINKPSDPKESRVKVRDPDTFDGSDPRKLRDFLVSCNLHFRDRPKVFSSDEKRILFVISYLKGSALSWFEPGLMDHSNSAHWMWDFEAFISELEVNFGPHDPVGDAEKALTEISMKENSRIVKYNVEFWKLASRVDWNESALTARYFRGLPLRLRTEVLRDGKPTTLPKL